MESISLFTLPLRLSHDLLGTYRPFSHCWTPHAPSSTTFDSRHPHLQLKMMSRINTLCLCALSCSPILASSNSHYPHWTCRFPAQATLRRGLFFSFFFLLAWAHLNKEIGQHNVCSNCNSSLVLCDPYPTWWTLWSHLLAMFHERNSLMFWRGILKEEGDGNPPPLGNKKTFPWCNTIDINNFTKDVSILGCHKGNVTISKSINSKNPVFFSFPFWYALKRKDHFLLLPLDTKYCSCLWHNNAGIVLLIQNKFYSSLSLWNVLQFISKIYSRRFSSCSCFYRDKCIFYFPRFLLFNCVIFIFIFCAVCLFLYSFLLVAYGSVSLILCSHTMVIENVFIPLFKNKQPKYIYIYIYIFK